MKDCSSLARRAKKPAKSRRKTIRTIQYRERKPPNQFLNLQQKNPSSIDILFPMDRMNE